MIYLTDGNGNTSIKVPLVADSSGNMFVPEITDTLGDDREIYLLNTRLYLPAGQAMAFFPSRRCPGIVHAADDYNTDGTLKAGRAGQNKPVMPLVSMAKTYGADTSAMPYVQIDDTDPENPTVTSSNVVAEHIWVDSRIRYATAIQPYWDYTPSTGPGRTTRFFHQPCVTRGVDSTEQWEYSSYPASVQVTIGSETISSNTKFYPTGSSTPHVLRAFMNMGRLLRDSTANAAANNGYRDQNVCMNDGSYPGWYFDNNNIVDPNSGTVIRSTHTARMVYPPAHPFSHAYQRALEGTPGSVSGFSTNAEIRKAFTLKYHCWFVLAIPGLSQSSAVDAWKNQLETYSEIHVPVSITSKDNFDGAYPYCYTTMDNGNIHYVKMTSIRVDTGYKSGSGTGGTGYLVIQGEYEDQYGEFNRADEPRLVLVYKDNPGAWNRAIRIVGWGMEIWPREITRTCGWIDQYQTGMVPNFEWCTVDYGSTMAISWLDPSNRYYPGTQFNYGANVMHDGTITNINKYGGVSGIPTTWDTFADQFG